MKRLVVMVSGNGSNLQALIDACEAGSLEARIVGVVSNRAAAFGLERAACAGIQTRVLSHAPYGREAGSREAYDADLADLVAAFEPDLVVLAGWMRILTTVFLDRFPDRVVNLHPALPGQFAGTRAIERAFEAFRQGRIDHTGVMVHWVIPEVDAGEPIATRRVAINAADSLETLTERIHATEHELLVSAVAAIARGEHAAPPLEPEERSGR